MASRRSACLNSVVRKSPEPSAAEEDSDYNIDQPRPKRRKANAARSSEGGGQYTRISITKRRGGKLRLLPEMPLDILYEIFGHLNPFDLLRLARSTKSLRDILMRRSAISVWKEARSNIENLPDCPPDLTEPQYANLAFNPYCHYCYAPNVNTILWACRVRCCKKCMTDQFIEVDDVHYFSEPLPSQASSLLPYITQKHQKYWSLELISFPELGCLSDEYVKIMGDEEKVKQFMEDKRRMVRERQMHADLCESWQSSVSTNRSNVRDEARQSRKNSIVERLTTLGLGEEITLLDSKDRSAFFGHPLVKQPKQLTDRIWTNIKVTLIPLLEDIKEKRLKRDKRRLLARRRDVFRTLLNDYTRSRPADELVPQAADVYFMENVKAIIEETPSDVEVTADAFTEVVLKLPQLSAEWRASKVDYLMTLMPAKRAPAAKEAKGTPDFEPLNLATTYFKCYLCREPISYPRVLVHRCMVAVDQAEDHDLYQVFTDLNAEPWNYGGNRITYHKRAHQRAKSVVKACGFDPNTATAREMDEADLIVECLTCSESRPHLARPVMGWRKAVIHASFDHAGNGATWACLGDDESAIVKAEELWILERHPHTRNTDICCVHCNTRLSPIRLKDHIRETHGIEEALQRKDYIFPIDASMNRPVLAVRLLRNSLKIEPGRYSTSDDFYLSD